MPPKHATSRKRKLEHKGEEEHSHTHDSDVETETDKSVQEHVTSKPKRRATKKAKVEEEEEEVETADEQPKVEKKSKAKAKSKAQIKTTTTGETSSTAAAESDAHHHLAPNGQPTNKVMPVHVAFPPRAPGTIRLATWNICGLAASQKKGFKYYVEAEDPDVLVLTETKVNNAPVDPALAARFPHRYWAIAEKKSYGGTAVLSKHKPLSVSTDLPGHPDPGSVKGRILTLEFEHCYVVGTYVVNAGQNLKTLDAKKEWNTHFTAYIRALDSKKPVIWTGDLNVAPTEKDLTNPKTNWNKTAGYTEAETSAFAQILDASLPEAEAESGSDIDAKNGDEGSAAPRKFVDIWRRLHPEDRHYTYFSYRFNCRMKGIGWRLDMFVVSERLVDRVKKCEIRSEIYGASDHCPVVLEMEGAL